MMSKSTSAKPTKPAKPYPEFPLFPHATGRWAKKIRGRQYYFGRWADPQAALERYLRDRDALYAGRKPRPVAEGIALRDLINRHLTWKEQQMDAGEISSRTFRDHFRVADLLIRIFGRDRVIEDIQPDDFGQLRATIAKSVGPYALTKRIQITRAIFDFGHDSGLLPRPTLYGPQFRKPPQQALRKAKQARPPRLFERDELLAILDAATPVMRAMVLLGLNAAYGNSDISALQVTSLDLANAIATSPRSKNAIMRRATLWPETCEAVQKAIAARPNAKHDDDESCVFLTRCGVRWVRDVVKDDSRVVPMDSLGQEFKKLLNRLGIKRAGVGFYSLRHTFRDRADECPDRSAIDYILGHSDSSDMKNHYVHRVTDDRLKAVVEHVHQWLFDT